jgi:hypothetical protein
LACRKGVPKGKIMLNEHKGRKGGKALRRAAEQDGRERKRSGGAVEQWMGSGRAVEWRSSRRARRD